MAVGIIIAAGNIIIFAGTAVAVGEYFIGFAIDAGIGAAGGKGIIAGGSRGIVG